MTDGIAPVDQALLPAAVRNGSAERKENYQAALAFERVLVGQLTEQLSKSFGSEDEDGKTDGATQLLKQQMPSTLADALMAGGGIGLASQMDQMWNQTQAKSTSLSATDAKNGEGAAAAITPDGSAGA
ncbi:MAG: hypothetical protein J7513_09910 [Solirubrobacteraceae bacterium]|nr:hypothetical protein [Solirubrobacteraceae bacterium]